MLFLHTPAISRSTTLDMCTAGTRGATLRTCCVRHGSPAALAVCCGSRRESAPRVAG